MNNTWTYRGCILADGDGSRLRDARPLPSLLVVLAILLALFAAACSAPPRAAHIDDATREAAHRALIEEVRVGQLLGYSWRYKR